LAINTESILLATAILLLISIGASKLSEKVGVPSLLFFLIIGMVAGSDGLGGIYFDSPQVAQFVGVLALISILFSGGLDTKWKNVQPILIEGVLLSTVGVLLTAIIFAALAAVLLNLTIKESFLLGAIISSTDAAAVFTILKSKRSVLPNKLKSLIEFESVSNDPMAVLLTVGTIHLFTHPSSSVIDYIFTFLGQISLGIIMGVAMGKAIPWLLRRVKLEHTGLYPVLTISLMLFTYSATTFLGGSGFVAVFLTGMLMGNAEFEFKAELTNFHDSITWLMQIIMFLALGLLVYPTQLVGVVGIDLLFSLFLILAIRPASVFLSLSLSKLNIKEKTMISWVGIRGAVPIILATFPLIAGVEKSTLFFNMVFFIVLTSILVQGTTISALAKWLKLDR